MAMFTAQLAAQLAGPALVVLVAALGTPALVFLLRFLDAKAAAIQNTHFRTLATDAVHAIEQIMASAPSGEKKIAATSILLGFGVPASLAGTLVESSVKSMNDAALDVQTYNAAPAPPPITVVMPPAAGPSIETPAGPPSTRPH
jgi:hypothetical protein